MDFFGLLEGQENPKKQPEGQNKPGQSKTIFLFSQMMKNIKHWPAGFFFARTQRHLCLQDFWKTEFSSFEGKNIADIVFFQAFFFGQIFANYTVFGGLELSFWAKTEFFKILGIWVQSWVYFGVALIPFQVYSRSGVDTDCSTPWSRIYAARLIPFHWSKGVSFYSGLLHSLNFSRQNVSDFFHP